MAATWALANLAKEDVPDSVSKAYGDQYFHFGREYLIPKPFDSRVLIWEASAVAKAAMESGVAKVQLDLDEYRERLEGLLGRSRSVMRTIINKARTRPKRIVYPEGENQRIIRATAMVREEGLAIPILLGRRAVIEESFRQLDLELGNTEIIDPEKCDSSESYAEEFFRLRQRKGQTLEGARLALRQPDQLRRHDGAPGGCRRHDLRLVPPPSGNHPALVTDRGDEAGDHQVSGCT